MQLYGVYLIGGVGGYGTGTCYILGQIYCYSCWTISIALFAVPAGGMVEEIENIKNEEINVERNRALTEIFQFDHLESWKRGKIEIGLPSLRRKVLKISDAKLRLLLTDQELIEIARDGKGIRLKNFVSEGVEQHIIESFWKTEVEPSLIKCKYYYYQHAFCRSTFLNTFLLHF